MRFSNFPKSAALAVLFIRAYMANYPNIKCLSGSRLSGMPYAKVDAEEKTGWS